MKRFLKRLVPLFLAVGILASVAWYLLVYDREFTRDLLISQARQFDARGNADFAAMLYDLAYDYTGKDEDVAIELANQHRNDGNYTKAEYTLTHAIYDGGNADVYAALCKIFVEQDKLLDAVALLDGITDPSIKAEIDALRPSAPAPNVAPGYFTQYITLELTSNGSIYATTDGDYPSTADGIFSESYTLSGGETVITALSVSPNGLVSPLCVLNYTVGGVIEEAVFTDSAMEQTLRAAVGMEADTPVMTDQLWEVTELTLPEHVQVYDDLKLVPYLKTLTISGVRLNDLGFLAYLPELAELNLTGCRFPSDSMAEIAALPNLNRLTLSNCALSTIAGLENAGNLTYVDLSHNTLRNLQPLSTLTKLQEIHLEHNAITDLTDLAGLAELSKLDISYNSVSSLTSLSSASNLSWINAGNNAIANLEGIEAFPMLSHLDLNHNSLTSVSVLAQCTGLTELNVSNNAISNIDDLSALTELTALNVSYNTIAKLPTWPEGSKLSILEGSHNQIESVYPLHNLEELTYVYLDYNQLHTIDPIADCFRLVMVNVYGNEISDVSKLKEHNIIVNYDPT